MLKSVIDFGDIQIFEGVTTYPAILVMQKIASEENCELTFLKIKNIPDDLEQILLNSGQKIKQQFLSDSGWEFEGSGLNDLRKKIIQNKPTLKQVYGSPCAGIKTGFNQAFILDEQLYKKLLLEEPSAKSLFKPIIFGKNVEKWFLKPSSQKILYIPKNSIDIEDYPNLKNYLSNYKTKLSGRAANQKWYELQQAQERYEPYFSSPKIIYTDISDEPQFSLDKSGHYLDMTTFLIPTDDKYLLGLLNSKLFWFFLGGIATFVRGGFLRVKNQFIEKFPIPDATPGEKDHVGSLAEKCQSAAEGRYEIQEKVRNRFADLAPRDWDGKLNSKLINWWELDKKEFHFEIKKLFKKEIILAQRDEWEDYLTINKDKILKFNELILEIEKELNLAVYALFKLTPSEIKLLEENSQA